MRQYYSSSICNYLSRETAKDIHKRTVNHEYQSLQPINCVCMCEAKGVRVQSVPHSLTMVDKYDKRGGGGEDNYV